MNQPQRQSQPLPPAPPAGGLARPAAPPAWRLAQALPGAGTARAWQRVPLMALAVLALWLLYNPWEGFWHDSQMYAVQALRVLAPQNFQQDLYFLFGSQDRYTLFSPLYAAWVERFGLDGGAQLLHAIGSLLWLAAAASLAACFLRGFHFWLCLAFMVLLPSDYGATAGMLHLREPFLTPRLFAEGLSMFALTLTLRGKGRLAGAVLALSCLLHPLMTLGAILLCLLYGGSRRALLWAAGGAGLALGAGVLGVAPFSGLLHSMDADWLAQVRQFAPTVAWDDWRASQWLGRTVLAFGLVLAAAWLSSGRAARWFACVAVVGALGLLGSWLGTGLLHNVFIMQVQPSRLLWPLHLAAGIALAWLAALCWRRGRLPRLLVLLLLAALLLRDSFGAALAVPAALALCWALRRRRPPMLARRLYRLGLAGVLVLLACWLIQLQLIVETHYVKLYGSPLALYLWIAFRMGGGALLAAGLLWCLWRWAGRPGVAARLAAWCVVLLCCGAALLWRAQREEAAQRMSPAAQQAVRAHFLPRIPPHAVVAWDHGLRYTWYLLQRSSYASPTQVVGSVFNRGTALEGARRLQRLQRLGMRDAVVEFERDRYYELLGRLPAPSLAGLDYVCADPVLGFVVLNQPIGRQAVAQVHDLPQGQSYYLFDCAVQRAGGRP